MFPNYAPAQFVPVRGANAKLWDQTGREYIDFAGGVAVLSLGHSHPAVLAAMNAQASKVMHLPTHKMLKANPFWTDLLTNWSGRESKPTCPVMDNVRDSPDPPPMLSNRRK